MTLSSIFGTKALMAGAYAVLVFLDCFTRLCAISHERLVARGEEAGFLASLAGLPAARREGLIRSGIMRRRGVEKLVLYNITFLTAAAADFLSAAPLLSPLVAAYLSMTEALSIIENLSAAGAPGMKELLEKIKGKGR